MQNNHTMSTVLAGLKGSWKQLLYEPEKRERANRRYHSMRPEIKFSLGHSQCRIIRGKDGAWCARTAYVMAPWTINTGKTN